MSTERFLQMFKYFREQLLFNAAIISADIVTSSRSLLVSSTSLRVVYSYFANYIERERKREKTREDSFKTSFPRLHARSYIVNRFTEIFDSSPGNSKNSSTFKPSKPSRLRPSTDSGLLSFPGSWGAFNGSKNRPPADIVVFEYPRLLQRSYFVVTATFSGKLAETSIPRKTPAFYPRQTKLFK